MKKHIGYALGATTALALSLASGTAAAQALRPNLLVIFDTSGSMLSGGNDGSPLCGGNGTASRIYNMKNALRQAMAQVGTDEANFGLMRFPQVEDATLTSACPRGRMSLTGTNSSCRFTTHSGNETTYGPWFDNGVAQALLIPVTDSAGALKPVSAAPYDPSDANIADTYRWIDLTDSGQVGAGNPDPELRSNSGANTPLGRSLFYARLYFENYVYPQDPKKACRQDVIILATDGAETCDTTKGTSLNTTTCAQTPAGSYGAFHPEVTACAANHSAVIPKGIKTYVLTDNALNATEKANANLIAAAGGTSQAIFVTLTDTNAVKQAFVDIIASTVPPSEVCNGVDDNCNGLVDEGVKNMCPLNTTTLAHCAVETCNCADDDCDGQIDEGFAPNACGGPGCCPVPAEMCNGLDDNCDGNIDEGFNVGAPCFNNGIGACRRGGRLACNAAGNGTFCDAPVVTPSAEVCNNIDDDCNGLVDDGMVPGVGEACGSNLGVCRTGTFACTNGRLTCNQGSVPGVEVCNGLDDNCDGVVDNGSFPTVGQSCICAGLDPAKIGIGECRGGHIACKGGLGLICADCVGPSVELCDGKDNDCDGITDTQAMCPSGFGCKEGQCALLCQPGEFPCPPGYKCVADYCVPQRCATVDCPTGSRCDEDTGLCVDLCAGVTCMGNKHCELGRCVDCETTKCGDGQICYGGLCRTDPCDGVTCDNGGYCSNGQCVDLCVPGKCGNGQRCVAGECIEDKCYGVSCADTQYCDPATGKCKTDICDVLQCAPGERCAPTTGKCATDPCRLIQCPNECWTCGITAEGTGTCMLQADCRQTVSLVGQKGGGMLGTGCSVGGSDFGGAALGTFLGVALLLTLRRRRSRCVF